MKFKAIVVDPNAMVLFEIMRHVEKVNIKCAIQMSDTTFRIIAQNSETEVQAFAELHAHPGASTNSIFRSFKSESRNANKITVYANCNTVVKALKSALGTKLMTMKLAKKDHQCMSIILEKNGLSIVQDVPINLVTPKNAARIQEPSLPAPDMKIVIDKGSIEKICNVIERMKHLDKFLNLEAHADGTLIVGIRSMTVEIKTYIRGLDCSSDPVEDADSQSQASQRRPLDTVTARVQLGAFAKIIAAHHMCCHSNVLLFILEKEAVIVHSKVEGKVGALTHFMPCTTAAAQ